MEPQSNFMEHLGNNVQHYIYLTKLHVNKKELGIFLQKLVKI